MLAEVHFKEIFQDSQEYGSNDEHMVSRIIFDLILNGVRHENLFVDVKQPVGSSFEDCPLEISIPSAYKGPFNHEAFRDVAERYYRSFVGGQGNGIRIGSGTTNVRMRNNHFIKLVVEHFEISSVRSGW
jgi:hypothetical protein